MNPNIRHVGLDVDDTQYHGSAFNNDSGEVIDFRCRPTLKGLLTQLNRLQGHFPGLTIRLCYEASYVGFCLQRDLRSHGLNCDVVAPSSVPSPRGKTDKTDRIDAGHRAQFYANDLLTIVQPPDAEQELDRDLLRLRQKLLQQINGLNEILAEEIQVDIGGVYTGKYEATFSGTWIASAPEFSASVAYAGDVKLNAFIRHWWVAGQFVKRSPSDGSLERPTEYRPHKVNGDARKTRDGSGSAQESRTRRIFTDRACHGYPGSRAGHSIIARTEAREGDQWWRISRERPIEARIDHRLHRDVIVPRYGALEAMNESGIASVARPTETSQK